MALACFIERTIARVQDIPVDLRRLSPTAIRGSLYSGAAGVAFFLHEAARLRDDDSLLERARCWNDAASAWVASSTPDDWRGFASGIVLGRSGPAYVDALLAHRAGDTRRMLRAVERIDELTASLDDRNPDIRPGEMLGGYAGVLGAARDLAARFSSENAGEARTVLSRIERRMISLLLATHASPLASLPARERLGVGHGIAGELWMLASSIPHASSVLEDRLGELAMMRHADAEGLVFWPPTRDTPGAESFRLLATWCHGVAGHTLLWCEVARRTRRNEDRELARASAETLSLLSNDTPQLCCGLTGQSLALQSYADLCGDARLSRVAYQRLIRAAALDEANTEGSLLSLWQGSIGIALVAMKRLARERGFPVLEPPRRVPVTR